MRLAGGRRRRARRLGRPHGSNVPGRRRSGGRRRRGSSGRARWPGRCSNGRRLRRARYRGRRRRGRRRRGRRRRGRRRRGRRRRGGRRRHTSNRRRFGSGYRRGRRRHGRGVRHARRRGHYANRRLDRKRALTFRCRIRQRIRGCRRRHTLSQHVAQTDSLPRPREMQNSRTLIPRTTPAQTTKKAGFS
jgi:hypothetical protein